MAVLLLLLIAASAAAEWAGWPFLRLPLAQRLSELAAVPVTIASPFRLRLLGTPTLSSARLTVAAAAGTPAPFLLDATDVRLSLRWSDLWAAGRGGGVRVAALQADMLVAHLLRSQDGRASWQVGVKADAAPAVAQPAPVIERLSVRQATVVVDDRPAQLRLSIEVAEVKGDAGAACRVSVTTAAAPCLRFTALGVYRRADVKAEFDVSDMLSLFSPQTAGAAAAQVSGQAHVGRAMLKFAGSMANLAQAPALQGALSSTGPSLGSVMAPLGVNLPETPPFVLHGEIGLEGAVWTFAADRIELGSSRLAGRFAFDTSRQPGYLSGQLRGKLLAFQDLGPSVGVQAAAADNGRVLPDKRLDIPSLKVMDADIDVAIDALAFGTTAVAPLSALRVAVSLQDGLLKLDKLSAQVAGGTVRGSSSLQAKGDQARWQASLQFDGIALSRWLRALQAPPPSAARPAAATAAAADAAVAAGAAVAQAGTQAAPAVPYASGTLQARLSLAGAGRSVAEVLGGADGLVQASLTGATLSHLVTEAAGLDVGEALGILVRGDRSLVLRCARVQAPVMRGLMGPVQGVVDNIDSVLRLDGQINLGNEALDLRLVAKPKDFSPLSLRSPVHVRGNLGQPRLSVEAGPIAARVVGALVLGAVAPLLAWIPLVDAGESGDSKGADPCAAPAAPAAGEKSGRPAKKSKNEDHKR